MIKFFDGGMGSMLNLKAGELPEKLNITEPERVFAVHEAYAKAGAEFITANTFGANALKYDNVDEIVKAGVSLAKKAGKRVALDLGPTGKLLKPMGELDFEKAVELFAQVVNAGKYGADVIIIETMSDTYELKAAVLAAKENSNLPVIASMIFDDKGRLLTGADVKTACTMLEGLGADVIGINCGLGPKQMIPILKEMRECTSMPIIVMPNAGLPESVNGKTVYNVSPEEFAEDMREIAEIGVSYLGGCCGTTPEHISKMIELCRDIPESIPEKKSETVVCSYSTSVTIGSKPVIIGERINPTGKKLFKEALRNNNIDYILKEGIAQQDKGAHILDVNVGLPEIDEVKMLSDAVYNLQSVLPLPLQLDSSDAKALENAMRIYNGKAMINSVNGKKSSMEQIFPLVKKYGGVVVCLCLDENGIPETAQGRIDIAKKIISTAQRYGIDKKDLVVDALVMTISTNKDNAVETLKAVKYIRNELGVATVLGVSNISFGLPSRESINTAFFTLALENGLSAGIINPLSESMMNAYYSFNALSGFDDNCAEYIESVTASAAPSQAQASTSDLKTAIIKGIKEDAGNCARELLKSSQAMEVINEYIIPALDIVGDGFEKNKIFLPQLLMSADAAKEAFDVIKEHLTLSGKQEKSENKIIIATVEGDIHDIGKNIVKVLLSNYGFDVIDLGKDVKCERVLEETIKHDAKLVALSALMTTTVSNMEKTIRLIHENTDAKTLVGGAVLTKSYAKMIDADYYAKDAMESVRIAKAFFGGDEK
ncbi:MAG: homocysteine S-methyltransferase family protein [Eubacterium sp.]